MDCKSCILYLPSILHYVHHFVTHRRTHVLENHPGQDRAWTSSDFPNLKHSTNWTTNSCFLPILFCNIFCITTSWTPYRWRWQSRWGSLEFCTKRPPNWPCGWRHRLRGRPPTRCCSQWCPLEWPPPLSSLREKQVDSQNHVIRMQCGMRAVFLRILQWHACTQWKRAGRVDSVCLPNIAKHSFGLIW